MTRSAHAWGLTIAALAAALIGGCAAIANQPRGPINVTEVRPSRGPVDGELARFLSSFREAVRRHDFDTVARMIAPTVQGFRSREELLDDLRSAPYLWTQIDRALQPGGAMTTTRGAVPERREFCAPYTYTNYPTAYAMTRTFLDAGTPWVIITPDAPVHAQPDLSSPIVTRLSYRLVVAGGVIPGGDWVLVFPRWPASQRAFVRATDIRDPSDYHVCFATIDGRWQVTAFARARPG